MPVVYWLVLIFATNSNGANPQAMHVGNFSSYTDCQNFGKSYTTPVAPSLPSLPPTLTMLCIQANQAGGPGVGTNPPPG